MFQVLECLSLHPSENYSSPFTYIKDLNRIFTLLSSVISSYYVLFLLYYFYYIIYYLLSFKFSSLYHQSKFKWGNTFIRHGIPKCSMLIACFQIPQIPALSSTERVEGRQFALKFSHWAGKKRTQCAGWARAKTEECQAASRDSNWAANAEEQAKWS